MVWEMVACLVPHRCQDHGGNNKVYIDEVNGDDNNTGMKVVPVKTFQTVRDRCAIGAINDIYIMSGLDVDTTGYSGGFTFRMYGDDQIAGCSHEKSHKEGMQ